MNDQEVAERQHAKEHLDRRSRDTNTCPEWHVFTLGSNGTAMVACGLPPNHNDWELYGGTDQYATYHMAKQEFADGSVVVFRWPL